MSSLLRSATAFIQTEPGRMLATISVIGVTALIVKLLQMRARVSYGRGPEVGHRRGNFVLAKNMVFLIATAIIVSIWASKIAGAALSLAAVAGAVLIVSKEFLANLLGSALLAISRPYRVGDFIEFDGVTGRVIDSDLLVTTIAEALEGSQITGRTVTVPHASLLAKPVHNLTATGQYVINLLTVVEESNSDIEILEASLLGAAKEVCASWQKAADQHLVRVESRELVDLPSAEPRVILQFHDARQVRLSLRYACRPNDKVWVEQNILRLYIKDRKKAITSSRQDRGECGLE
jgi:small-conductance mechanosensitive channel